MATPSVRLWIMSVIFSNYLPSEFHPEDKYKQIVLTSGYLKQPMDNFNSSFVFNSLQDAPYGIFVNVASIT